MFGSLKTLRRSLEQQQQQQTLIKTIDSANRDSPSGGAPSRHTNKANTLTTTKLPEREENQKLQTATELCKNYECKILWP